MSDQYALLFDCRVTETGDLRLDASTTAQPIPAVDDREAGDFRDEAMARTGKDVVLARLVPVP